MARKQTSENDLVMSTGAAAVPSRRKPARRGQHTATAAEPLSPSAGSPETMAALPAVAAPEPSRDAIARLAYFYWEERGGQGGCPEEDWTRAERELRGRVSTAIA